MVGTLDHSNGWRRLATTEETEFFCGVTLKFKTNDSGPVGRYQYALGVILPFNDQLMFISLEGQCWAHGPFPLPPESNANSSRYSVSVNWLRENLSYVARIEDPFDVWFAEFIDPVPQRFDETEK